MNTSIAEESSEMLVRLAQAPSEPEPVRNGMRIA